MEKKKCGEPCKGRILDAKRGKYCEHIEKLLPKYSSQSISAKPYGATIESMMGFKAYKEVPVHIIEHRLIKFGLNTFEVELLMLKYVEGLTFKQIMEKQGWTSIGSAAHYLRATLKKLRLGGFRL